MSREKETYLLYGDKRIPLRVPENTAILESGDAPAIPDFDGTVRRCLSNPIGSPPLTQLLEQKKPATAALTISDITRAVPNRLFLPYLLRIIEEHGVDRKNITIIVGTGMHRPSTGEEHRQLVGEEIFAQYRVIDHNARDPRKLERIPGDPPISINAEFLKADFKIVTGFIEPHFMAGFSGGRKGVCPALVDLKTVQSFHGFETLSSPKASAGILEGNPCHEIALSVAHRTDIDFLFNVTLNRNFQVSGIFCGDMEKAHESGCKFAAGHAACTINTKYDLVVTNGGGYPLDCNYYQSVKGMCMALPAVRQGGTIFQISECREGIGSKAFTDLLLAYGGDWKQFLLDIESAKGRTQLDQWEVQMLCRVLEKTGAENLRFLSEGIPGDCGSFICCTPLDLKGTIAETAENYIHTFSRQNSGAKTAVIPSGPYTIIRMDGQNK